MFKELVNGLIRWVQRLGWFIYLVILTTSALGLGILCSTLLRGLLTHQDLVWSLLTLLGGQPSTLGVGLIFRLGDELASFIQLSLLVLFAVGIVMGIFMKFKDLSFPHEVEMWNVRQNLLYWILILGSMVYFGRSLWVNDPVFVLALLSEIWSQGWLVMLIGGVGLFVWWHIFARGIYRTGIILPDHMVLPEVVMPSSDILLRLMWSASIKIALDDKAGDMASLILREVWFARAKGKGRLR